MIKRAFEALQQASESDEFDTIGNLVATSMRKWASIDNELTEDFRENLYASILDFQVRVRASGKAKKTVNSK